MRKVLFVMVLMVVSASVAIAGGWDAKKGMGKVTLKGQLVCMGCSLKKLDGTNAQCSLYTNHAIGFKTPDGTMWSIVDNEKGHDVINAHNVVEKKNAKITGWLSPIANFIEIDTIEVDGVTAKEIQKAAWEQDQEIAKALSSRKMGEVPVAKSHGHKH